LGNWLTEFLVETEGCGGGEVDDVPGGGG